MSFNFIGNIDILEFKKTILNLNNEVWNENNERQKYHNVLNKTHFIPLMWDSDTISQLVYGKKTKYFYTLEFDKLKENIEREINLNLGLNGVVFRAILAKLDSNHHIPEHIDGPKQNNYCKKIHIPIVTNDKVFFNIEGEEKNLKEGEIWEVDVSKLHSAYNNGTEDRVHLIVMYNERKDFIQQSLDC